MDIRNTPAFNPSQIDYCKSVLASRITNEIMKIISHQTTKHYHATKQVVLKGEVEEKEREEFTGGLLLKEMENSMNIGRNVDEYGEKCTAE